MAKIVKKSVIPIYVVAAVWAVWALLLPLYHAAHFLLAAAVATVAWAVARKVCKDTVLIVPDPKPEPVSTGDSALDALIAERDRALSEMKRLNASIEDPVTSAHIDHLETVTGKIISHVVAHPEKQSQIRRFMDYYLPTTLKLLNAYDRMDETGISGANIDGTKGKITDMMSTISTAFDRQLDALFGGEAMDISTDITVMEQMLAREGLGGTQLGS